MITFVPYCRWLVHRDQFANLKLDYQSTGENTEKRPTIANRVDRWCCCSRRSVPFVVVGLFVCTDRHRKACMASTKRPAAHTMTSAAPRGRRVVLSLSDYEYSLLCHYAGRYRLTPRELLKGSLRWIPEQPAHKFLPILLDATKGSK